jgi:hypothetical protein
MSEKLFDLRMQAIKNILFQLDDLDVRIKDYFGGLPSTQDVIYEDDHTLNGLYLLRSILISKLNELSEVSTTEAVYEFVQGEYIDCKESLENIYKLMSEVSTSATMYAKVQGATFVSRLVELFKVIKEAVVSATETTVTYLGEAYDSISDTVASWFSSPKTA